MLKFLFLLLFPIQLFAQSGSMDSIVVRHFNWYDDDGYTSSSFIIDSVEVNGLIVSYFGYDTTGTNVSQTVNTFSSTGKLLSSITQNYINNNWLMWSVDSASYNSNDSLLQSTNLQYYYTSGIMDRIRGSQKLITYDTLLNTSTTINQDYVDSLNLWLTNFIEVKTFDLLGRNIITQWLDSNLILFNDYFYCYLPNDSLDYYIIHNSKKNVVEYNLAGYRSKLIGYEWRNSNWELLEQRDYYYDAVNNLIAYDDQLWMSSINGWDDCHMDTMYYSYNSQNLVDSFRSSFCGGSGAFGWFAYNPAGSVDSMFRCSWSHSGAQTCTFNSRIAYALLTSVEEIKEAENIDIFPNPTNGEIVIDNRFPEMRIKYFEIRDIFSRLVYKESVKEHIIENKRLNMDKLTPGVYFVLFYQRNGSCYFKQIIKI